MENVSTMVDSILNALWWPWSRNSDQPSSSSSSSISLSSSPAATKTIASTIPSSLNDDLQFSSSPSSVSSTSSPASYYIPFGSLFNPVVANDTSVIGTAASNISELFTTGNNSSLFAYSNFSTFRPFLDFNAANESGSGDVTSDNLDYYYNFGENITSINHSYIFASPRTNNSHDKILLDGPAGESTFHLIQIVVTAIILGIVILATVIGNVFVIAAILLERNLQSVSNHLILSLAVADLLVACLVMPLGAVYEVSREWSLGPELCDMWTSSDVLCCTASILHLVAIALDRYWAVTDIDYAHQRTSRRIGVMILIVWALSFLVSIAPLLGWKDPGWIDRLNQNECIVSQDVGYQIFATTSSFYFPLLVILFLYWRIFLTARKRIRRRQQVTTAATPTPSGGSGMNSNSGSMVAGGGAIAAAVVAVIGRPLPTISETTTQFTTVSSTHTSPEKSCGNGVDKIEADLPTADISMVYAQQSASQKPSIILRNKKPHSNKAQTESKRERKAAKTLAIITGAFVCCWLPFFILAILLPTCKSCNISPFMMSICLWLGYFNSTLNPIIYTIFSPEFRHAFKRILCGRRRSSHRRRQLGLR
ncbi:5-hydroxytryptamine receptor-like, partial [Culicoides brevitarsis]|uniref:5-hydroxytryptamine receptor-like n=1 Tax=Culicoides brevitarsis TaxID=469753 RepID=UPI00307B1529